MSESQFFELLGRKQAQLETLDAEYTQLLLLLDKVLKGEIAADQVKVDMEIRRWVITPKVVIEEPAA